MNLFVCYRPNHILKALLLSYYHGDSSDCFIIETGEIEATSVLAAKLKTLGYNVYEIDNIELHKKILISKNYKKTFFNLLKSHTISNNFINFDLKILDTAKKLFLFQDQNFLAHYFLNECYKRKIEIDLIEDGFCNYKPKQNGKNKIKMLAGIFPIGYNHKINSVYLFKPDLYKGLFKNKIQLLDKKYIEFSGNKAMDDKLKYIFDLETVFIDENISSCTLILTQPLNTVGVNAEEQMRVYKKIASQYSGTIIIKRHPQDTLDYSEIFENIIEGLAPFELLISGLPKNSKIVSLFSTSTYLSNEFEHINLIDPLSENIGKEILKIINKGKI